MYPDFSDKTRESIQRNQVTVPRIQYNIITMREIAIGAVKSQLRIDGFDPVTASLLLIGDTLGELARRNPNLIASIWYRRASKRQWNLWRHDWIKWQEKERYRRLDLKLVDLRKALQSLGFTQVRIVVNSRFGIGVYAIDPSIHYVGVNTHIANIYHVFDELISISRGVPENV